MAERLGPLYLLPLSASVTIPDPSAISASPNARCSSELQAFAAQLKPRTLKPVPSPPACSEGHLELQLPQESLCVLGPESKAGGGVAIEFACG